MPTNKNALLRYKILDRCFRNRFRKHNIHTLTEEVSKALEDINNKNAFISKRTIQNDIKFMKSIEGYNAPIEIIRQGRSIYYRYTDFSFSIFNQPLIEGELRVVKQMYEIINSVEGRIEYKFLKEILFSIDKQLPNKKDTYIIIEYDDNPFLKNYNFLGSLFEAIKSKQTLEYIYKPFVGDILNGIIHPYFLKQYNNRWFLFALEVEFEKKGIHPVNFALDRFIQLKNSNVQYIPNTKIDFNTYFSHMIGVTKPTNKFVVKISFEVSDKMKPYLETKPLHESQKPFIKHGKKYISSINVIPNYEMFSLFLSHGEDIKILAPEEIVEEFKTRLEFMRGLYE